MNEHVVVFGATRSLVGVVTDPDDTQRAAELPAVVLLNAGLLHRVGPNRIYVGLARALAGLGFTVMRFDFSGMGDSQPRADHLPYVQSAPAEANEAMAWLSEQRGAQRFVLIGHCSGALFSFMIAHKDPRVVGTALISPEGGNEQWSEVDRKRKTAHYYVNYYAQALFSRERWRKLLSGQASYRSIVRNLLHDTIWYRVQALMFRARTALPGYRKTVAATPESQAPAQLRELVKRGVAICLIHYEGGTGHARTQALFGSQLNQLQATGKIQIEMIPQSDHMFTLVARQRLLIDTIVRWAQPLAVTQPASVATNALEVGV